MIRWYDYAVIFFFADFISAGIMGIFLNPGSVLPLSILVALAFMGFDGYSKIRKAMEEANTD